MSNNYNQLPKKSLRSVSPYEEMIFQEIYYAAVQVFKINMGLDLKWHSVKGKDQKVTSGDISAVLEMKSPDLTATLAICFDKNSFLTLTSKMLGEEFTELTPEIHDAASEICNQIYGVAKARLSDAGHKFQMAIPKLTVQEGHPVPHGNATFCVVVGFKNPPGFNIELSVAKSAA